MQFAHFNKHGTDSQANPSGSSLESSAERAVAKSETSMLRGLAEPRSREIRLMTMWPRTASLLSPLWRCSSIFWTEVTTSHVITHNICLHCLVY